MGANERDLITWGNSVFRLMQMAGAPLRHPKAAFLNLRPVHRSRPLLRGKFKSSECRIIAAWGSGFAEPAKVRAKLPEGFAFNEEVNS